MHYNEFTKKDLADILDLIQISTTCKTEADIIKITSKLRDMVCADRAICAIGEVNTGRLLKIVNLNWPTQWAETYMSEELYNNDPIIRYNYEFFKTHTWSEALKVFSDDEHVDLMNRASDFGLKYGLSSGVNGESYKGSIFSFSGSKNSFSSYHMKVLDIVTPHIHQALVRFCGCNAGEGYSLSQREKEVLKWMKEGKTNWEISVILSISERTIKFHVQNIERKLNAVNKAHAIAIAMDTGLVA
jgi:DNA-binding CsgD family transcriptional regulator